MSEESPLRVGVLGLHHDHIWSNLEELSGLDDGQLVAAADPNQPLLDRVKNEHGCTVYSDYREMLDQESLDAVYVFVSNREGAKLCVDAARRGLHVMVEKPMAADLAGAEAMLEEATTNQVRLMVNWPFVWWAQLQHAINLARSGEIGRIWQVKYRAAHQGPAEVGCTEYFCNWLYDEHLNGGGALMDYCCYGSVLASVLLGKPEAVSGLEGNLCKKELSVEDNAMLVLRYPEAIATTEASWTQVGKLTAYVTAIYGETGTLLVEPRDEGGLLKATNECQEGEPIHAPELPPHLRSASAHFIWAIRTGGEFHPLCDPIHGRDAQAILEAGRKAAKDRCEVALG